MTGPTAESDVWIRRFQAVPDAAVRLVCFPHAGGAATFYFPVAATLGRSKDLRQKVEALAVQYPGRQDRRHEQPITDLKRLAEEVHRALEPWWDDRLVFFGHSMGAIVAFEVARRMERGPAALVASGRSAPSRRRDESLHLRDDDGIVRELKQLSGTDASLLADEALLRLFLPAVRADYEAVETYQCPPGATVDCPVTVFVGDSDPHVTLDEARAWAEHTTGGFELEIFEGDHFYLTAEPAATMDRLSEVLAAHV